MNDIQKFEISDSGVLTEYTGRAARVVIPDGVREIDRYVFCGLDSLEELSIPDTIETVDRTNFAECDNLRFNEVDGVRYLGNDKNPYLVLYSADTDIRECAVRDGCRLIMEKAFDEMPSLARVSLPGSLRYIGFMAFYGCEALSEVSFSDGLLEIDDCAFSGCAVRRVALPSSVRRVGRDAFGIARIDEVLLSDEITHIGAGAFTHNDIRFNEYCGGCYLGSADQPYLCFVKPNDKNITAIELHTDCRIIYSNAFMRCENLKHIVPPDGVLQIGENAFRECHALESVALPESLALIGECAFASCDALRDIEIPRGRIEIESGAFAGCSSLERITLSNATVGDNAFDDCSGLVRVTVGEGANLYGDYIFAGCSSLREVILPKKLKGRFDREEFEDSENTEIKYI